MEPQTAIRQAPADSEASQVLPQELPPEEGRSLRQVFEAEESALLRYASVSYTHLTLPTIYSV